jgi:membrane-bound lytic murein transglycosylase D
LHEGDEGAKDKMGYREAKMDSSILRFVTALALVGAFSLTGCALKSTVQRGDVAETTTPEQEGVPKTLAENEDDDTEELSGAELAARLEGKTIGEVLRTEEPNTKNLYDDSRYDFPITVNSKVEAWMDYFTGRGRHHMERYLARSSRYIPLMRETLKKEGLPQDLVYLALIESGFNLRAKSRARAVGPWQFMKPTGKRYGLRVDAWVDERRDFVRSTEAASRYLKDLYLMFESWYLAASAYNAGEFKILRAINTLHTNNYWRICETNFLRRETKDYVPKLIAAAVIAKNPEKYGFDDIEYEEPIKFDAVTVDFPLSLPEVARLIDVPTETMEDLNPELLRNVIPEDATPYALRIPVGKRVLVERALTDIRSKLAATEKVRQHVVRSGETLRSVSQRYRVSVRTLANANNMSVRERLTPGLSLIIPSQAERLVPAANASREDAAPRARVRQASMSSGSGSGGKFVTHVVREGESLWSISEKYDVTVREIFRWNNLRRSRIFPGKRLRIQVAGNDEQSSARRISRRGAGRS